MLLSKEADAPRAVASLTKIAAVLAALEWLDESGEGPDLRIPVPPEAVAGGANPLGLRAGDELTLETAFAAAMMASDNTSTHAFAEAVGRRIDPAARPGEGVAVFVARMNRLAERLGSTGTRFVNPHGLDGGGGEAGVSTARDVARLALAALDRPDFLPLAAAKEREVSFLRGGRRIEVRLLNTNELVGTRGIDGLKTGTTRRSGPCLVVTATRRPVEGGGGAGNSRERRLVAVLLDSGDRFGEAVALLDEAWRACERWLAGGGGAGNECLRKTPN